MTYEYDVREFNATQTSQMKKDLNALGANGWKVVGIAMQSGSLVVTVILMREEEGSHVR